MSILRSWSNPEIPFDPFIDVENRKNSQAKKEMRGRLAARILASGAKTHSEYRKQITRRLNHNLAKFIADKLVEEACRRG